MTKPKTPKPTKPKAPPKEYPGLRVGFMLEQPEDPMSVRVVDEDAPPESGPMLRVVK